MHPNRSSGQQQGGGKPFVPWPRRRWAVVVSFCLGAVVAASAGVAGGGCGALDIKGADADGAEPPACEPPPMAADEPVCVREACCPQLTSCSKDSRCLSCYQQVGTDCESNNAFVALQNCREHCLESKDAGYEEPEAGHTGFPVSLTLAFIHAAPELFPVRMCLRDNKAGQYLTDRPLPDDALLPHSNLVGLAPGGAFLIPNAQDRFEASIDADVTPYLINAKAVKDESRSCDELICNDSSCLEDTEYVTSAPIRLTAPNAEEVSVLVIRGCRPYKGSIERCGATYLPDTGNIQLAEQIRLSLVPNPSPGTVRVFAAQLSPSIGPLWVGDAGSSLRLEYGTLAPGGSPQTLLQGEAFNTYWVSGTSEPLLLPGDTDAEIARYGEEGFTLKGPDADGGEAIRMQMSLASVQELADASTLPAAFWRGSSDFLVALLGDVTAGTAQLTLPDGGANNLFDGYGLHVLAVPLRSVMVPGDAGDDR